MADATWDRTMKAVVAHGYGPAAVLAVEDVPVPQPGPGQVQVRVGAAALNPADLRSLSGVLADLTPLEFPHVPGSDFAGTVTATGPGVTRFAVGDEVFGAALPRATLRMATLFADPPSLTTGSAAEYAVVEAGTAAVQPRPRALGAERAAALPLAGLTALAVLRAGAFAPGATVLVIGATGGVGSLLVPLLAAAQVHVMATAGADDSDYVRGLGARETVDHRTADVAAEAARRHPGGLDAVVNLALPGPEVIGYERVVRPGGRLLNVAFSAPDPADFTRDDVTVATVYAAARPGDLAELAARAAALPTPVGRRYPLSDGARAYRDLEQLHTRGKLLILP